MQFAVNILTARYRKLPDWEILVSERPYWRLWWSEEAGISVETEGEEAELTPERVVLLAPHTTFNPTMRNPVHHLNLHFQLEAPFDLAVKGIYTIPVTAALAEELEAAKGAIRQRRRRRILVLTRLINSACLALPDDAWREPVSDARFVGVMSAMEQHQGEPLSNVDLAAIANMAPTAFVRSFSQRFGISPQAHYLEMRLEKASLMLEYEKCSIEHVAETCGFCDRNYFSTVFRKKLGVPPATFRKMAREG
ncbi:MAG: helix-turn-helix domain-containing protein [Verrucomicrobia bacterium]|jgi:AraC-like DNA-binding protein|nr:helix-turn-helix domain-containing protein [Verrucomicrobiota bacterium]